MSTPGRVIHTVESGPDTDTVVLLVHGSLDRSAGMARLARVLQQWVRVVRYDRRGYGRSWPHPGPFGVADQADDLLRVLDGRQCVAVGHSYGGHPVLASSIREPERFVGVSVYETPLSWMDWWPSTSAGAASVEAPTGDAAEAFMRRLIGDRKWEELPERTRAERRREGTALQGELGQLREGAPWSPGDMTVPLLCGHGSRGLAHHARAMELLATEVRGARFVTLEGAGHGAPNTHPEEFVDLLVRPHLERAGISTS